MRLYNKRYIDSAEIVQLIILHCLYTQKESKQIFFQGGTAIRWCYGGTRFSEDLDFVTSLKKDEIARTIEKSAKIIERAMVAHFGMGSFSLNERKSRATSYRAFLDYRPAQKRGKISVRTDFEQLKTESYPENEKFIFSTLPGVAPLIATGIFKIPSPHSIIVVETPEEILSDKVRSLLERKYLKGRDFYDIWFLTHSLQVRCTPGMLRNKFSLYEEPFVERRPLEYFLTLAQDNSAIATVGSLIRDDLQRFIPQDMMNVVEKDNFKVLIQTVASVIRELFIEHQ